MIFCMIARFSGLTSTHRHHQAPNSYFLVLTMVSTCSRSLASLIKTLFLPARKIHPSISLVPLKLEILENIAVEANQNLIF